MLRTSKRLDRFKWNFKSHIFGVMILEMEQKTKFWKIGPCILNISMCHNLHLLWAISYFNKLSMQNLVPTVVEKQHFRRMRHLYRSERVSLKFWLHLGTLVGLLLIDIQAQEIKHLKCLIFFILTPFLLFYILLFLFILLLVHSISSLSCFYFIAKYKQTNKIQYQRSFRIRWLWFQ